jgi:hypothetical protein
MFFAVLDRYFLTFLLARTLHYASLDKPEQNNFCENLSVRL